MYRFKRAESPEEFEQIFRLNHDVFAAELGQYSTDESARRIDKFHDKNQYAIALEGGRVVGMIAFHDQPPYSVAERLPDPAALDALGRIAEIRLLAIDPAHRTGMVIQGLMCTMYEMVRMFDAIAISGLVSEQPLYAELGFRPLGPAMRSGKAEFVPMAVRIADLEPRAGRWMRRFGQRGP